MTQTIRKAILPVAGLGTRFLPATKAQPKEMLPIVDKPVIQILVEEAIASGITDIIFVTGKGKHALEDHFDSNRELEHVLHKKGKHEQLKMVKEISASAKFTYVRQKYPNGDGDAILSAAHLIGDEPFVVMFGDDIIKSKKKKNCLSQMIDVYERYQDPVIAVERVPKKDTALYGVIDGVSVGERVYEMKGIVEKPEPKKAPSNLAVVGKYILTPDIFDYLKKADPRKGEVRISSHGLFHLLKKRSAYGYEFDGVRFDCGSKIGFLKATVTEGLSHPETKREFKKYLKSLGL